MSAAKHMNAQRIERLQHIVTNSASEFADAHKGYIGICAYLYDELRELSNEATIVNYAKGFQDLKQLLYYFSPDEEMNCTAFWWGESRIENEGYFEERKERMIALAFMLAMLESGDV